MSGEPVTGDKLDVLGEMFGLRFDPEDLVSEVPPAPGVTLYVEDDGLWYPAESFARSYLEDLSEVVRAGYALWLASGGDDE